MVTVLTRLVVIIALYVGEALAQSSPLPGPTAPPATLPVPKAEESLVINPCRAGWHPGLKWTEVEFLKLCRQLDI